MHFKTLLTSLLLLPLSLSLQAQDDHAADSLRHQFGRKSVGSARSTATPYADTLDTGNPAVKVVLYDNGTYRYVKDPKALQDDKVFTEHWDTRSVNPYHDEKPLPDRFSLWIVDTLDSYCCPNKTRVYSKFGYRHGRRHQGVDLPYPTGTPVYAAFDGKVRVSDYVGGYGNLIIIRHANGLETFYGHLSRRDKEPGDWVNAGDIIGLGGSTGRSSGPHLHFETRYQGYAFDPTWLIDFETGTAATSSPSTTKTRSTAPTKRSASSPKNWPRRRLLPAPPPNAPPSSTTRSAPATPWARSPRRTAPPSRRSAA